MIVIALVIALVIAVGLGSATCSVGGREGRASIAAEPAATTSPAVAPVPPPTPPPPTSPPPGTPAEAPRRPRERPSRSAAPAIAQAPPAGSEAIEGWPDEAFWRRLADCESADGRSGRFLGYFQFSRDTAAKVGVDGSESYEEQRAAAEEWLRRIGLAAGGTRSGWPTCWWRAGS